MSVPSPAPIARIQLPSIQSLFLQARVNGTGLSTATGFVVLANGRPCLVTNRHVVTGRNNITGVPLSSTGAVPTELVVLQNRKAKLGEWLGCVEPLYSAGAPLWTEHPTLRDAVDVVALPLASLTDVELYPYDPASPGPNVAVSPAEPVSVVGFPFGVRSGGAMAVWATGFVATEPDIDHEGLPQFLIDCRARPGQSGSAVIAHRTGGAVALDDGNTSVFAGPVTRFLGVYSGRINEQSDLGIVWKLSALNAILTSVRPAAT